MPETKEDRERNDGFFVKLLSKPKERIARFRSLSRKDKLDTLSEFLLNNAMFIIIITAVFVIAIVEPRFISWASIINIISLTAAKLPIALGIGGAIVLTGTDISAGRAVGLTACIGASLLQMTGYSAKMFPNLGTVPVFIVLIAVMAVGAVIGLVNGFFVAGGEL